MAIQFVVEDGTGKTDATSYVTEAEFRQYWENRGVSYPVDPEPEGDEEQVTTESDKIKAYLNIATQFVDSSSWSGCEVSTTQALKWPRIGMVDSKGVVLSTVIPQAVKDAVCYLGSVSNRLTEIHDNVSSQSFGPVSTTYNGVGVRFPVSEKLLEPYLISGNKLQRVN